MRKKWKIKYRYVTKRDVARADIALAKISTKYILKAHIGAMQRMKTHIGSWWIYHNQIKTIELILCLEMNRQKNGKGNQFWFVVCPRFINETFDTYVTQIRCHAAGWADRLGIPSSKMLSLGICPREILRCMPVFRKLDLEATAFHDHEFDMVLLSHEHKVCLSISKHDLLNL